jgi:hypothetical protein
MLACSYFEPLLGNLPQMSCQRIETLLEKMPRAGLHHGAANRQGWNTSLPVPLRLGEPTYVAIGCGWRASLVRSTGFSSDEHVRP